jgi:hypothetical protein
MIFFIMRNQSLFVYSMSKLMFQLHYVSRFNVNE